MSVCVGSKRRRPCLTCIKTPRANFHSIWLLVGLIFVWGSRRQKCSTDNKSTLELACLTGFQPRLSLFVYCNRFDNELKVRFRVISRARLALVCDCSRSPLLACLCWNDTPRTIRHCVPAYCRFAIIASRPSYFWSSLLISFALIYMYSSKH